MMYQLTIPKPCFENWEQMLPNEKGRHCNACEKTVVDFTKMSDEDVANYFLTHKEQKTCGRFQTSQIDRIRINFHPKTFKYKLPYWQRFLVVLLLIYGSTFLGIDTAFSQTAFMQGETVAAKLTSKFHNKKTKKKTKNKQNRRRKKNELYTIVFDGLPTMGVVCHAPEPKIDICKSEMMGFTQTKEEKCLPTPTTNLNDSIVLVKNSSSNPQNVPTSPIKEPIKYEFLIPNPLSIKKYLTKKTT